jgi:hypothetical protein
VDAYSVGVTSSAAPRTAEATDQRVPTPLAVAIIVGAVILGLVVVGAVVWLSEPRLSTGPAVAPPPRTSSASEVSYDARTRVANVQELRVELPRPPYECTSGAEAAPPTFTSLRTCDAPIHMNYNKQGDDWYASLGMAVVSPSLVVPGDLQATGDQVYAKMRAAFFGGHETTLRKRSSGPLDIAPPGKALSISSEVHYSVPGVSSSYDRMLLVVVELADGEYAICYSVRPNDTPKATLDVLNASLNTLLAK